ncbi:2TM domain-containing protein [Micromonospora sp. DT231]|uniref:2TM domain-containing protein n=1 Tax=Micromonospora sp. DT231 TaxID=3416526 RepID=UPI003CF4025C
MTSLQSENAIRWGLRIHLLSYVIGNLAQIVVWWFATPDHFFWPLWSILGWGVGLAFHGWAVNRMLAGSHRSGQPYPGR